MPVAAGAIALRAAVRASKKIPEVASIRGKNMLAPGWSDAARRAGNGEIARPNQTQFSFHTLLLLQAAHLIHLLFTPAVFIPAQRLQIRNQSRGEQGKIGTLFSIRPQKILDDVTSLAGSIFYFVQTFLSNREFVRRTIRQELAKGDFSLGGWTFLSESLGAKEK